MSIPPRLPHQADHCLLFGPALLPRHVGQVCSAVAASVPREADADAMLAELPRERAGRRFEVRQQCDAALEGGQLARGDGEEAGVVEGAVKGSKDAWSAFVSLLSLV